jgi:hypothetical protein
LHIVPHSTTDEGGLSTADNYFTGKDEDSVYIGSVKDILDSVYEQLMANPNRTFTFAEVKFFKKWYEE